LKVLRLASVSFSQLCVFAVIWDTWIMGLHSASFLLPSHMVVIFWVWMKAMSLAVRLSPSVILYQCKTQCSVCYYSPMHLEDTPRLRYYLSLRKKYWNICRAHRNLPVLQAAKFLMASINNWYTKKWSF
jgi:hypothetical protein